MATRRKKPRTRASAAAESSSKRATRKPPARRGDETIEISVGQFRSLVLERIRAEIAEKRARYEQIDEADLDELLNAGYWKSKYWKVGYWKSANVDNPADQIVNPATKK